MGRYISDASDTDTPADSAAGTVAPIQFKIQSLYECNNEANLLMREVFRLIHCFMCNQLLTEIHVCTLHAFTSPSCVKSSCGSFRCAFRHSMFIGGLKSTGGGR